MVDCDHWSTSIDDETGRRSLTQSAIRSSEQDQEARRGGHGLGSATHQRKGNGIDPAIEKSWRGYPPEETGQVHLRGNARLRVDLGIPHKLAFPQLGRAHA